MINDRRAFKRLFLHSQVEITGVDESGLQFAERARVEDVSDLGCRLSIRGAVHEGSILGVEPLGPEGEDLLDEFPRLFVIIWIKRKGDRLTVGVRSLREDELSDSGTQVIGSALNPGEPAPARCAVRRTKVQEGELERLRSDHNQNS